MPRKKIKNVWLTDRDLIASGGRDAAIRRLVEVLGRASDVARADGSAWYGIAGGIAQDMADATDFPVDVCAAVLSHLSPQTSFAQNVSHAWHVLTNPDGTNPAGAIGSNVERARAAILAHYAGRDALGTFGKDAHKTRAFALAILGDTDAVVIDVWQMRIMLADGYGRLQDGGTGVKGVSEDFAWIDNAIKRVGVYDAIAEVVRDVARAFGIAPTAVQAISWVATRGRKD